MSDSIRISPTGVQTKMDPEGQLYVPSNIRKRLAVEPGEQFDAFITEEGDLLFRRTVERDGEEKP